MEKIYLSKEKIESLEFVGKGCEGRVLKLDNNIALKLYNSSKFNLHDFKFTNLKFDYIILPKSKVYINKKYIGHTMKYIDGKDLNKINISSIPISLIIEYCKRLRSEIKMLSDLQVPFKDLNKKNILYKNGFYIIDSFFDKDLSYNKEECFKYNNKQFNKIILYKLLDEIQGLKEFILNNNNLKDLYIHSIPFDNLPLFLENLEKEKVVK